MNPKYHGGNTVISANEEKSNEDYATIIGVIILKETYNKVLYFGLTMTLNTGFAIFFLKKFSLIYFIYLFILFAYFSHFL